VRVARADWPTSATGGATAVGARVSMSARTARARYRRGPGWESDLLLVVGWLCGRLPQLSAALVAVHVGYASVQGAVMR